MSARIERAWSLAADALVAVVFFADSRRPWGRITNDAPRVP